MTYRAVLVGSGNMSRGWLSALLNNELLARRGEIVVLVDISGSSRLPFGLADRDTARSL